VDLKNVVQNKWEAQMSWHFESDDTNAMHLNKTQHNKTNRITVKLLCSLIQFSHYNELHYYSLSSIVRTFFKENGTAHF
jgi:hypothetical protein